MIRRAPVRRIPRGGLRAAALLAAAWAGVPGVSSAQGPAASAPAGEQAAPPDPHATAEEPSYFRPGVRTRFAFVDVAATVRDRPYWDGRHVGRLVTRTPDGTDEVVLVRARAVDRDGRRWAKVTLPSLPNGRTGWVPRDALGQIRFTRQWLKVDRRRLLLELVEGGEVTFTARIGVGARRWPTPAGDFVVRSRLSGPRLGPIYGPLAFGTSARSAVLTDWPGGGFIGIHGTDQPGLLPGRVSHGCIRLRNRDVLRLGRRLHVGTPVSIR